MSTALTIDLLKGFGLIAALSGAVLGLSFLVMLAYVKSSSRGKLLSFFIEPNRQVSTEMLKLENQENPEKLRSKDGGDYILDPRRTYWYQWPANLPSFVRQPVPSSIYVRNRAEPLDLESARSTSQVTAQTLRHMTDEGMFRQMWKDARESIGETKGLSKANIALYISIATIAVVLTNGFLTFQMSKNLELLATALRTGG